MLCKIKDNKGITLSALVIYIIVFMIVISIMTTITTFFYSTITDIIDTPQYLSELNKFIMFFGIDIKNYNTAVVTDNQIQFEGGPIYKFENNSIYRDNVLIAQKVLKCTFTPKEYNVNNITKNLINVDIQIGKDNQDSMKRKIDFTLKYW